jgi:hypothetical protein
MFHQQSSPCGPLPAENALSSAPLAAPTIRKPHHASPSLLGPERLGSPAWPRCSERGCVYPASDINARKCRHHERLQREPHLFCSFQPTLLVVEQARYNAQGSGLTALSSALELDLPEDSGRLRTDAAAPASFPPADQKTQNASLGPRPHSGPPSLLRSL